jgi:hypothetical protein
VIEGMALEIARFLAGNRCIWPTAPVPAIITFSPMISIFLRVDCSMNRWPPPSPNVAELSAPITTPSLQRIPTMAVSVAGPKSKTSGVLTRCLGKEIAAQREERTMFANCPALVLNADFQPLSYFPLSLFNWEDAVKAVVKGATSSLLNTTRSPAARRSRCGCRRSSRCANMCGRRPGLALSLDLQSIRLGAISGGKRDRFPTASFVQAQPAIALDPLGGGYGRTVIYRGYPLLDPDRGIEQGPRRRDWRQRT